MGFLLLERDLRYSPRPLITQDRIAIHHEKRNKETDVYANSENDTTYSCTI